MLPPIDPATLENNPNFNVLYKDLCTRKLNLDGSSKELKKARVHEEIRKNLKEKKTERAKQDILLRTLSELPSKAADLPPELHEVIEIVTAQLTGDIAEDDLPVIKGDVDVFLQHMEPICTAIASQLTIIATHIAKIADPLSPPPIPDLPTKASTLLETATITLPSDFATAHIALSNLAFQVLTTHLTVATTVIRILESTKHGSVARGNKARAELLGTRSKAIGLLEEIHTLTHPPPPITLTALNNYKSHLQRQESELKRRQDLANAELGHYERAGRKQMLDIARRARFLREEIGRCRAEVERLEGGEM